MTCTTLNYLLTLALAAKDRASRELIATGSSHSPDWGQAAEAVRELLEVNDARLPLP